MNIFKLHENPFLCAMHHCDKHVVKMIIEYAQLLSTAHRVLDGTEYIDRTKNGRRIKRWLHPEKDFEDTLYKASHIKHPSGLWVRESMENYCWLHDLWVNLCEEYTHRYGKEHLTYTKLKDYLMYIPQNIPDCPGTPLKLAMPDDCKGDDPVESYRTYYRNYKRGFATWKKRSTPEWF